MGWVVANLLIWKTVVRELKMQCVQLSECYGEFQKLVTDQSNALFGIP